MVDTEAVGGSEDATRIDRRSLLGRLGAAGVGLLGTTGVVGAATAVTDDSSTDESPTVESTIEQTNERTPETVDDGATITVEGSTIHIDGHLAVDMGDCYAPTIEAATTTDGSRVLVQIGTRSLNLGAPCLDAAAELDYEATVTVSETPETVTVVHGDRSGGGTRGWRFLERWWADPIGEVTTTWSDESGCTPDTPPARASIGVTDATVRIEGTTSYARQYPPLADVSVDGGQVTVGFLEKEPGARNLHIDCIYAAEYAVEIELQDPPSTVELAYWSHNGSVERTWPPADLPPVDGTVPRDIDGDGLHGDFSGNGRLDFPDVNAFFQHTEAAAVQDHPDAYDFTGDGTIDLQDVLALFEMV